MRSWCRLVDTTNGCKFSVRTSNVDDPLCLRHPEDKYNLGSVLCCAHGMEHTMVMNDYPWLSIDFAPCLTRCGWCLQGWLVKRVKIEVMSLTSIYLLSMGFFFVLPIGKSPGEHPARVTKRHNTHPGMIRNRKDYRPIVMIHTTLHGQRTISLVLLQQLISPVASFKHAVRH